jgi:hypothetical protein
MTRNRDLSYSIKGNDLWISISTLLGQEDYAANWNGDNSQWTEKVLRIHSILSPFSNEHGPDLQIWEDGNAFVQNLKPEFLNNVKEALEGAFNETFELNEKS